MEVLCHMVAPKRKILKFFLFYGHFRPRDRLNGSNEARQKFEPRHYKSEVNNAHQLGYGDVQRLKELRFLSESEKTKRGSCFTTKTDP